MSLIATGLTTAATIAKRETIKAVTQYLKDQVIGRWSEYRANRFLTSLLDEVHKERDVKSTSSDLNDILRSIANSENQTSALFDAYRRVVLSASRDLGPMVIGLLTAKIVLDDRIASEDEERVFEAAEILTDKDFEAFQAWINYLRADPSYAHAINNRDLLNEQMPPIVITVRGGDVQSPIDFFPGKGPQFSKNRGPLNLYEEVGPFAHKLRNIGLLSESSQEHDVLGEYTSFSQSVLVHPACEVLCQLSLRAAEAAATM